MINIRHFYLYHGDGNWLMICAFFLIIVCANHVSIVIVLTIFCKIDLKIFFTNFWLLFAQKT